MSENIININPEQMKELARLEKSFDFYISQLDDGDGSLKFPEPYQITLEDIDEACRNIIGEDMTVKDFTEKYFYPLYQTSSSFGIDNLLEDDEDKEINGLPVYESDVFASVWSKFEDIWTDYDEDDKVNDTEEFEMINSELKQFFDNRGKPYEEMWFSDNQKYSFADPFGYDWRVKEASETELTLARRFIDEFCKDNNVQFLYVKGYACYGGNRLYECDWNMSRDIMLRLYDLTEDPSYQNTLGYIYYYGRCTGGKPEYEKAFKAFSIGAANGYYESMYKLADMFHRGCGCRKSDRTAWSLYDMVYTDLERNFVEKGSDVFADAALRMGNVYAEGIYKEKDLEQALAFYYQAKYANDMRMKNSDFFGNTTVAMGISKAIDKAEKEVPDDFFEECIKFDMPYYFRDLVSEGYRAILNVESAEDGRCRLIAERVPRRNENCAKPVFLTDPHIKYSELVTKVEFVIDELKAECFGPIRNLKFDYVEKNQATDSVEFWYDDTVVCRIYSDEFRFYPPVSDNEPGELLKFVSVSFNPGNRTYDYLCDIDDVKAGDKVVVMGYDGETEVEVISVFEKYENELSIPLERYKKVLRKV